MPVHLDMGQECFATSPVELARIKAEEDARRREQEKKEEAEAMIHKIEAMVLFVQGHSPADDVLAPVLVEFFKS